MMGVQEGSAQSIGGLTQSPLSQLNSSLRQSSEAVKDRTDAGSAFVWAFRGCQEVPSFNLLKTAPCFTSLP